MGNTDGKWRLFKVTALAMGIIAAAFWLAVAIILALGLVGFSGATYALPLVLATLGLYLVFGFLWQTFALVRVGDLLERIEALMEKGA